MLLRLFFPQVERLAGGVKAFQFDAGLGAYDPHKYVAWQTLSGFITEEVVRAHGGQFYLGESFAPSISYFLSKLAGLKLESKYRSTRRASDEDIANTVCMKDGECSKWPSVI
jgi:hypothetical protein